MEVVNILAVIVGALTILVTALIGWQIYIGISFEKRMKSIVEANMEDLRIYADKKVAGAKYDLLTAIITTQIDLKNWDMIALISSYIPQTLIDFNADEDTINKAIRLMHEPYCGNNKQSVKIPTTQKLEERIIPLISLSSEARAFQSELLILMNEHRHRDSDKEL